MILDFDRKPEPEPTIQSIFFSTAMYCTTTCILHDSEQKGKTDPSVIARLLKRFK